MDASQFKERFLPCHEKMFRMAWRLTGNAQAAEDLVQEAFLKLWMKRDGLHVADSYEAFSIATIRNLFYDQQRKPHLVTTDATAQQLSTPYADGADKAVEAAEGQQIMMQLIRKLPEQQQQIIMMKDVDDMDYCEIEQQTGLTAVHIRVLLSRARKQIRQQLKAMKENGYG